MSIGIKVDLFQMKLTKKLKADNFEFSTYGTQDQKAFKVVLSGLPRMDTKAISEELKHFRIINH